MELIVSALGILFGTSLLFTLKNPLSLNILIIVTILSFLLLNNLFVKIYFTDKNIINYLAKKDNKRDISLLKLFLVTLILGFVNGSFQSSLRLNSVIDDQFVGKKVIAQGEIVSLPNEKSRYTTFLFAIDKIEDENIELKTKINWYFPPPWLNFKPGDNWQLMLRLKKPHGMKNPHSSDYEKYLFVNNINGLGYVVKSSQNRLISSSWIDRPIDRIRLFLHESIDKNFKNHAQKEMLKALLIGEQQGLTDEQWQVFQITGTAHLIAISGMNVGLIAGFIYFIAKLVYRIVPKVPLFMPAQQFGAWISLLAASFYSLLAGFSLPTQRALIMLAAILCGIIIKRKIALGYNFLLAFILILIVDPFAILTASFWLSFIAVFMILYALLGRIKNISRWYSWFKIQIWILIGLLPISLCLFHYSPTLLTFSNFIAIPWSTFIIIPLILLGALIIIPFHDIAIWLWRLALINLEYFYKFLKEISRYEEFLFHYHLDDKFSLILISIGVLLLLVPIGVWGRYLVLFLSLPLLFAKENRISDQHLILTLLDVGHGLAVTVQTSNHIIVFDTGARLGSFDLGKMVIVPFLKGEKVQKIDRLIISHGDNDHIGGLPTLLENFVVKDILTSLPPAKREFRAFSCQRDQNWSWDGVQFRMLGPRKNLPYIGNNSSCVLKITTGNNSILIPADIEKLGELNLLKSAKDLAANILIAPHHGSLTSSTPAFIKAVDPNLVLYATGPTSRFKLPNSKVLKRFANIGALQYSTYKSGAIQIKLTPQKIEYLKLYRRDFKKIWNINA